MTDKNTINIKSIISPDTWNAIKDSYERGSYSTSITNLLQFINEIIQDKANLENVDNTSLVEQAFFVKKLCINKLQTRSEKDIQEGIGHILKGACLSIRNPRSHERYNDDKLTADRIILFYDYILEFIRKSEEPNLINDWLEFICDNEFVATKEYAEETFKRIPQKKRYDLLINIFRKRSTYNTKNLGFIVEKLLDNMTASEFQLFITEINKDLIKSNNDINLNNFFNLYPPIKWSEIDKLSRLRVENLVFKSIRNSCVCYPGEQYNNYYEELEISTYSMLAVNAINFIPYFSKFTAIKNIIIHDYNKDKNLFDLYFKPYFSEYIEDLINPVSSESYTIDDDDELPF